MVKSHLRILILSFVVVLCYAKNVPTMTNAGSKDDFEEYPLDILMQDPRFYRLLVNTFHQYRQSLDEDATALQDAYGSRFAYGSPTKRNSELLNSLLGLPKNILKSG